MTILTFAFGIIVGVAIGAKLASLEAKQKIKHVKGYPVNYTPRKK